MTSPAYHVPVGFTVAQTANDTQFLVPISSASAIVQAWSPEIPLEQRQQARAGFTCVTSNQGPNYLVPHYLVPAIAQALAAERRAAELQVENAAGGVRLHQIDAFSYL